MFYKSRKSRATINTERPSEIKILLDGQLRKFSLHLCGMLARVERKLTLQQKKVIITLFSLVFGFVFGTSLYKGLHGDRSAKGPLLNTPSISVPLLPQIPDSLLARRHFSNPKLPIDTSKANSITK
jgi:hypothetical protein